MSLNKFDNKKYLRLTVACKKYLLENYPERFKSIFTGAARANKIRNEEHRRTRYHRLGELLILLDLADIKYSLMKKLFGKGLMDLQKQTAQTLQTIHRVKGLQSSIQQQN